MPMVTKMSLKPVISRSRSSSGSLATIAVLDQKFGEAVGGVPVERALGDGGLKLGPANQVHPCLGHHRLSTVILPLV